MSTANGPNYSTDNQITFIVRWFRTWSEIQKDDFVEILAQKLSPGSVNGLVNGMQKLDTGVKRVSLFSCQIKLFNEWWETWSESDKENLTSNLKDSDSKFWSNVQAEINGTRKKLEDDFFATINTCISNTEDSNNDNERSGEVVEMPSNGIIEEANDNTMDNTSDDNSLQNGHKQNDEVEGEDGAEHSG